MDISAALAGLNYGGSASIVKGQPTHLAQAYGRSNTMSGKAIHQAFQYEDRAEAEAFFVSHRNVAEALPMLRWQVSKVFGSNSPIVLSVRTDHEDGEQSLVARVKVGGEPTAALDKLDLLGEAWWFSACADFDGALVVGVKVD